MIAHFFMEVILIFLSTQSKKKEVIAFLEDLKALLGKADFNIDTDLLLIRKEKPDDITHSTPYTLLDLDYDAKDVIERLKVKGDQKKRVLCVSFHYPKDKMEFPYA